MDLENNTNDQLTSQLKDAVGAAINVISAIKKEISNVIVGQNNMIDKMIIGIISDGHILLEGVPGLAKTLAVKTLASTVDAEFKRIQFTPDLLPADIIGTEIYEMKSSTFIAKKGPIFANIILADEINRAPAKVQSALLEAMEEHQITIGNETYRLDKIFLVLATQNPIEQEGTYPLPEAQVDRFMLKVMIDYPTHLEERDIIKQMTTKSTKVSNKITTIETIEKLRLLSSQIYMEDRLIEYIVNILNATRTPEKYKLNKDLIEHGASPRAGIYLTKGSKAYALMQGRNFVIPDDIKAIAHEVLRHRIALSYEAQSENITSDMIIDDILANIIVP